MTRTPGRFVTFEGIEGVGKTTQVARARAWLEGRGVEVVASREPGGTPLAEALRALVLGTSAEPIAPATELLIMQAARAQHTAVLLAPAVARGAFVLCDRYVDATYAYQGGGRGVPDAEIAPLARVAQQGLVPDLTVLLDAPVALALARAQARPGAADRIEAEAVAFFERVRAKYLARARAEPDRIRVLDATQDADTLAVAVSRLLGPLLAGAA